MTRVIVRANQSAVLATKQVEGGCPANMVLRNGRWLAEVPPGAGCERFLAEAKSLPPETRKNLARHLVSPDSIIHALVEALLHH